MNLTVCIDGVEHAEIELLDGSDGFNEAAERGALDRAYELKESNPDSVVTILVDTSDEAHEWKNEHDNDCPVTRARADLIAELKRSPSDTLRGALAEYDNGGDQEVGLCTCGALEDMTVTLSRQDAYAITEALGYLASVDEGENTDYDELTRLSRLLRP